MLSKEFYRHCYAATGWLPMQPLVQGLAVGDVCQVLHGRFQPLLNLAEARVVEPLEVSAEVALAPDGWLLGLHVLHQAGGTHRPGEGDGTVHSRVALEFAREGGYLLHARAPRARLLRNWSQLRDDATLKLTQLHYGFRHAYVVTGVATAHAWGLAMAACPGARLELAVAGGCNGGGAHVLSEPSARVELCQGLAVCEVAQERPAHFFQAKKLVLSDAMADRYLAQVLDGRLRPADTGNWLQASLFDLVKSNELNLNTSIGYFSWTAMSLDDVELLAG
jgi:hypothetical protein